MQMMTKTWEFRASLAAKQIQKWLQSFSVGLIHDPYSLTRGRVADHRRPACEKLRRPKDSERQMGLLISNGARRGGASGIAPCSWVPSLVLNREYLAMSTYANVEIDDLPTTESSGYVFHW